MSAAAGQVDLVTHQLLIDFVSLSIGIYLAGFFKRLPSNSPLLSAKKISKVHNIKTKSAIIDFLFAILAYSGSFSLEMVIFELIGRKKTAMWPLVTQIAANSQKHG